MPEQPPKLSTATEAAVNKFWHERGAEYVSGYNARKRDEPLDDKKPERWRLGWHNADRVLADR